jgi:hypothetical protein
MGEKAAFKAILKSPHALKVPCAFAVAMKDSLHPAAVPPFIKERVKIILFSSVLKRAELIQDNPISCRNLFNFSGRVCRSLFLVVYLLSLPFLHCQVKERGSF